MDSFPWGESLFNSSSSPPCTPKDQSGTLGRLQKASKALRTSQEGHCGILHSRLCLASDLWHGDLPKARQGPALRKLCQQGSDTSGFLISSSPTAVSPWTMVSWTSVLTLCPPRRDRGWETHAPPSASTLSTWKASGRHHSESPTKESVSQMARVFTVTIYVSPCVRAKMKVETGLTGRNCPS